MDAKVAIWVGVRDDDADMEAIASVLPEASDEHELEFIWCSESKVGYGVIVFHHDWDYGTVEFDASSVQHKVEKARSDLQALFAENNIDSVVGVWCQTDFS